MQSESKKNLIEGIIAEQSVFNSLYLNFFKKLMDKKSLGIIFSYLILFLVAFSIKFTVAYYSDIETSFQNFFNAGVIDLEIANSDEIVYSDTAIQNSTTTWELGETLKKFFDFSNLKPSDWGKDEILFRIKTNPAWLCLKIHNIISDDATNSPPELLDDTSPAGTGELDDDTEFIFWDDANSNNIPDQSEKILWHGKLDSDKAFAIADSQHNLFSNENNPLEPDKIYKIKKAWCLGTFVNGFANCDGRALNNSTQGDTLTADISFFAIQARHNLKFLCEETPQEYKYYNCNKQNYTCSITGQAYKTRQECITQTGGDCFENNQNCLDACKPEAKEYFICNTCANSCSKTTKTYNNLQECQDSENAVCYDNQTECNEKCGMQEECKPFVCAPKQENGFKIEMLAKTKNCDGTYSYKFRITNYNDNGLSHVSISLPCGVKPIWPANGATYTSGHSYKVENTTNNPFYSIKYEELGPDGVKNGQSDIFEFKLDQYVADVPIQIETKGGQIRADEILTCAGMECPTCNKYYTCDCYVCGQTAQGYQTQEECEQKTGKACYSSQTACSSSAECKEPTITSGTYCGTGTNNIVAIARYGNNNSQTSPTEILIKKLGVEKDGKNHTWYKNQFYDFVLEYTTSSPATVKFTVKRFGEEYTVSTSATLTGSGAQIHITAPNCGATRVKYVSYSKPECLDWSKMIGGVEIDNSNPSCTSEGKYLNFAGLDFSKPFKLTGQLLFNWVDGTSGLSEGIPSMEIRIN